MTKKELMIKAHKMAKEIKTQYPTVDYKFQLGLCLSYLQNEGEVKMVELKGSEKQIKWAEDIRANYLETITNIIKGFEEEDRRYVSPIMAECREEVMSKIKEKTREEIKKTALDILLEIKNKIENEEMAKKFINVYNSFKYFAPHEISAISVLKHFR